MTKSPLWLLLENHHRIAEAARLLPPGSPAELWPVAYYAATHRLPLDHAAREWADPATVPREVKDWAREQFFKRQGRQVPISPA